MSTTYSIAGKQAKFNNAEDIKKYITEIKEFKNLQVLDFSGNTLGVEASKELSFAILQHKETITEINFSDLYTGRLKTEIPQSLEYLLPALLQLPNLHTINLSDNAFGLQTIDPIEAYLSKAVSVQHLILSNNGMGPFAGARIGTSIFKLSQAKKLANQPSLKTFICGRNRLENGSINHLALGLKSHADLEVVRLYQNGIRPAGIAKLIADGLSHNSKLKVIDVQDNTVTTTGAVEFATAILTGWPELTEINLNDSLLKSKGSLAIASALAGGRVRPHLKHLKLQYNELEPDALETLVDAVEKKLPNLATLELNGNRFEEESEFIGAINIIFEKRGRGVLDELDELEEVDSDEEEEEDVDNEDVLEHDLDLEALADEITAESDDAEVDELATDLEKAHIN